MITLATAPAVPYVPAWPGLIEGWVRNTVHSEAWKTSTDFEPEDLMQEGYLVYAKCVATAGPIENRQHFFGYFRVAFTRRLLDLAKRRTCRQAKLAPAVGAPDADRDTPEQIAPQRVLATVELNDLVEQVPDARMRALLRAALDAELPMSRAADGRRLTRTERLAALAGVEAAEVSSLMDGLEKWAKENLVRS